ncbi:hypothetical protein [Streptomyces mirabilis]|uniref:hypothetical protein n=1 Tax=Streptomyces mirabilis TaxID=68239 RepID=UPI0036924845
MRELDAWERQLFAGVRMVAADEATGPREYQPYDGPLPKAKSPHVIRYYGSMIQPDVLPHTVSPPNKEDE